MKWRITLGTISVLGILGLVAFIAANERERMASFSRSYESRRIEAGAALFESNCGSCHGIQGRGIEGVGPALNTAELFTGERLEQIGWSGTVEDYLRGVIAAGRPVPSEGASYPQRMPTWGEEYGGPLRNDQVEALVSFIMNWEARALEIPEPTQRTPEAGLGTDLKVELPPGDTERGETLAEGSLGCSGCHLLAPVGPSWLPQGDQGTLEERAKDRIQQADYSGEATTALEYLIEAVVLPNAYLVEGYQVGIMPADYSERLSEQDLADLIAYMLSLQ